MEYEEIKSTQSDFSNKVTFLIENRAKFIYRDFLINIFTCSSKHVFILPKEVLGKNIIKIRDESLFNLSTLLNNTVIAVPKISNDIPLMDFPKEEQDTLRTQTTIVTTRILNEYKKYKMGQLVTTPWGKLYTVKYVVKYRNIEDHPYFKELTEKWKQDIGSNFYEVITLESTSENKKVLAGDNFYIYGVTYKSIDDSRLPLSDEDGRTPGTVILSKLTDSGLDTIYRPTDVFNLSDGMIENYKFNTEIETTVGRYLLNYLLLVKPFGTLIEYINDIFNIGKIDKQVATMLLNNVISRKEYDRYMAYGFFIGQFSELCVPSMTRKSLSTDPSIPALKAKLLEENKDKLGDPVVLANIEAQLIAVDKAWLKDDSSADFYAVTAKKSYNEHRKKMFLTMGLAQAFDKNSTEYTFIPNSLDEGWDPSYLPQIANEVRRGSYDRGKSTAKGGEQTKFILRIFQNLRIVEDDCHVKTGLKILLTEKNYKEFLKRYIWFNNKQILLDEKNINEYLNKEIIIRSAMHCKTETGLCYKCSGNKFEQSKSTALGMMALDVSSKFTTISMKSMHFSGIDAVTIDTLSPYLF